MSNAAPHSRGLQNIVVRVMEVKGRWASVQDQYDRHMDVRADIRRGNGPFPKVGETWIIDRTLGPWSFAACLDSKRQIGIFIQDDQPLPEETFGIDKYLWVQTGLGEDGTGFTFWIEDGQGDEF